MGQGLGWCSGKGISLPKGVTLDKHGKRYRAQLVRKGYKGGFSG